MTERQTCLQCGAELPPGAPGGHCLQCLLKLGLEADEPATRPVDTIRISPTDEASPVEKLGKSIGPYKLLEKIGEGGFGVVYAAEQREPVRRRVALKILKLGMDTKQVVARFEAERQALALMDHPNIAKVFEAGATETGRPFFVMELVRGIPITRYCDENKLNTEQRLHLFILVCRAIQHAHQKGIIHRDIKPSNILVADYDGVPVPKIIDFGIAKATAGQTLTDKTLFTALEQFIGTPAYMSPEQAKLSGLDIDTRSDIYSLGVLLYELLTGKTPFDAKKLLEAGFDDIRRIIREEEPPRPSQKLSALAVEEQTAAAKYRQTDSPRLIHLVRGDLDWIVMKCLEKDRNRRYETANGLAVELTRFLNDEAVVARPPSTAYRIQKAWRRNQVAFTGAALIAALLLGGTAVSVWLAVRATRAETLAKQRLTESEAVSQFLTEVFQSPDPARDGRTVTVAETLGVAAKKLETDLANQPARQAKLQATVARTYLVLGLFHEAIPLLEKVRNYYLTQIGSQHPDTLEVMSDLANSYDDAHRWVEALNLREEVLALRRKVSGPEHPDTLDAMGSLASSYSEAGRFEESLKLRTEVLALCRKVSGLDHPATLSAMNQLANSYEETGRWNEALKLREEVLPLSRKVRGPEHPDTLEEMHNLALMYDNAGRRSEALNLRKETLELRLKVLGPEHADTLRTMYDLATSYEEAGRRGEALELREHLLPLRRKVLGSEHSDTLWALQALGDSYEEVGRRTEALKLREELLALRRKTGGPEHRDNFWPMENMATSYDEAGRRDEALKLREDALKLSIKANGTENRDTLSAMYRLAISYDEASHWSEALKLREEVLTLRRKVLGPEHPDTLWAMQDLANSYDETNRLDEALKLREELLALRRKVSGPEDSDTLWAMYHLANSYDKTGRRDEALKLRTDTLAMRRKLNGPESPDTITAMNQLANSYDEMGRRNEALKLREDAVSLSRRSNNPENAAPQAVR